MEKREIVMNLPARQIIPELKLTKKECQRALSELLTVYTGLNITTKHIGGDLVRRFYSYSEEYRNQIFYSPHPSFEESLKRFAEGPEFSDYFRSSYCPRCRKHF